ncbi:MAG: EAL domain-containing protein [Methylophilus sp.]|nr:EAL domain-containing protein [Methylophilus sp.]
MMEEIKHSPTYALNEVLNDLIEQYPDAILIKDGYGRFLVANESAKSLFKLHNTDWHGETYKALGIKRPEMRDIYDTCSADDEVAWNVGKLVVFDENIVDIKGNIREYEVRRSPIFNEYGSRKWLITIRREITDIRLAERNLRVADAAIESQEAIVISDANNRILRVNNSFTRLTGYSPEEVIGETTAILKSGRHDKSFYDAMWKSLKEKKFWQGEIWDRRKNGQIYLKWLTITAVTGPDGDIHNYIGTFTDLSEHKEAKDAIYRLAFYDPLTDLPNRRLFSDHMEQALNNSARSGHFGAVFMIDIDHFKYINDTKGHAIGDLLLIEVANRLKTQVRDGDTVARLGGDEFVILLEILSKDQNIAAVQAESVSKKVIKAMEEPFLIAGETLHCTLSIGISLFTIPISTSEEMLKRADVAMYQAKNAGRNTMRFFDPDLHASLENRQAILSELYQALPNDELKLYYQAQVDHIGNILGAEVLLRWEHPQRGIITPNDFIPLAEQSGLIIPIGLWVLHAACVQLKLWEKNPLTENLVLAVNVSARQFGQSDFVGQVCKVLEETGARASQLKIELTESLVIQDITATVEKMEALKLLGIRFSIDDFGTGYSSLSYLKRLPISQLKIDRSFVRDIDTDQNDAVIAQTIIAMASSLGFHVIAEGVETEAQRACLEKQGCLTYQGYLFSMPIPVQDFESLINPSSGAGK